MIKNGRFTCFLAVAVLMCPGLAWAQSCAVAQWVKGADSNPASCPAGNSPEGIFRCELQWLNSQPNSLLRYYYNNLHYALINGIQHAYVDLWVTYTPSGETDASGGFESFQGSAPANSSTCGKQAGHACPADAECGEPIVIAIGSKIKQEVDFLSTTLPTLAFERYYNSTPGASSAPQFAPGWTHTFGSAVLASSTTSATVTRKDGKSFVFSLSGGYWISDADVNDKLIQLTSGGAVSGWQYIRSSDDAIETYDGNGNLTRVLFRDGKTLLLTYQSGPNSGSFPAQLSKVVDDFGHALQFTDKGVALSMQDPSGATYQFGYGTYGVLSTVNYPDSTTKSYSYNESTYTNGTYPFALTGITDESNSRYDSTWYDASGLAYKTAQAAGANQFTITNSFDSTGRVQSASVLNPLSSTDTRSFAASISVNRLSAVAQPAASGEMAGNKAFTFDVNGNTSSWTDLNGNLSCSAHDLTRNLETARVLGLASGTSCPSDVASYSPASGTTERKTLTQWHALWRLKAKEAYPLKVTTWVYNGDNGNLCAPSGALVGGNPIGVLCSRTEQATTDTVGAAGFAASPSGAPRTWTYTYNSYGKVLTAKGPRTDLDDTTTYTYYDCATGGACGQLHTVTDAAGHVMTYNTYNANGQPLTMTDPNGTLTTMVYDARQRPTSYQVGSETTQMSYLSTGLVQTVTLPDSSTVTYGYDGAHRLTDITDGAGNHIHYTLDAMGNRTAETVKDASNVLSRTHSQAYNALSQLYQDIGANPSALTTFGHDANGNTTSAAAPLGRNSSLQYDALNRLKQVTDPASGITLTSYDAHDNVQGVTDPNGQQTTYSYNGFDELTQTVSPVTGTTVSTYDAGNLKTVTDARGAVATFVYDALNRPTSVTYVKGASSDPTVSFGYDATAAGNKGIGQLTSAGDSNHAIAWTYDANGRVTGKTQIVGGVSQSVGYAYTNGDRTILTTPSGQTITYGYSNHQVVSILVGSTTLASNVAYEPFGPVRGWSWGNSTTEVRSHDTDGNPSVLSGSEARTLGYDDAYRITSVTNSGSSALSATYGYDGLDRLTSDAQTAATSGWSYDANGNRQTQSGPSTQSALWSGASFTYNVRGRLATAAVGSNSGAYTYDALGQLILKVATGTSTILAYDEAGHLLGEYTNTGALIQETVWLGDLPVATLRPNGSGGVNLYYIHADQLGAPRTITRASDNALMWRWDDSSFGVTIPNDNPSGQGAFSYNLRFPGQYYQAETGLNYNYFRDYDPTTGRYVESDPIGLDGGLNTYAYAYNSSVSQSDHLGLNPALGCLIGAWGGPLGCGVGAAVTTIAGGIALAAILSTPGDTQKSDEAKACKPAIADVQPGDLCEQLALAEAKAGAGVPILGGLGDAPRLVTHYGTGPWIKMQHTHVCPDGRKLVIHYFSNGRGQNVELKFVM